MLRQTTILPSSFCLSLALNLIMIHLASYRQGRVEQFRGSRSINTPHAARTRIHPLPTVTNTPTETLTPTNTNTPTKTPTNDQHTNRDKHADRDKAHPPRHARPRNTNTPTPTPRPIAMIFMSEAAQPRSLDRHD